MYVCVGAGDISADPSRMLGERAGEECAGDGDRDRQTDRQPARQAGSQPARQTDRRAAAFFLICLLGSESNVRHWQGVTQVTIRHALTGG